MIKIAIPILLAGIVMIAGIFAFVPVEQASTVHTTIASNVDDQDRAFTFVINGTEDTNIQLLPAKASKTYSGSYTLSSTAAGDGTLDCGLDDGAGQLVSAANSTSVTPASGTLDNLGANEGIFLNFITGDFGVCNVTIFLDSGNE